MTGAGNPRQIALIGVPTDVGAAERGASMGPEALRIAGLLQALRELGHGVAELGDLAGPANPQEPPIDGYRHPREVNAWCGLLRSAVAGALRDGALPIMLGGDHSLSIGSIAGVADYCAEIDRPLSVVWFDAHADFNTPRSSPSGNIHGMPLAALCGRIVADQIEIGQDGAILDPRNVHLVGIRSVDSLEKSAIVKAGIDVYDMRWIDEHGMVSGVRRILDQVMETGGHLHVSFDVDFLDPSIAPAVGTTVAGGASFREAHLCMEMVHESGLLGSVDLVELNPFLDHAGETAHLVVDLMGSAFGKQIVYRPRAFRRQ